MLSRTRTLSFRTTSAFPPVSTQRRRPSVSPILTVQTGQFPCLLASLQITGNSIFLANYSFKVQLQGLNIYQNQFSLAAAGSSGTEFVQQGTTYLIPPNSTLYVYAYNSGETGSNGLMNVFAVFDIQM